MTNSFGARATLSAVGRRATRSSGWTRCRTRYDVARLPYTLRVLLENVLRLEDGDDGHGGRRRGRGAAWVATEEPNREISFTPARVLLQDFTGVPAIVDLAAMRDAMRDARRRSGTHQPAAAGRARHRPLRAGRRVRDALRLRAQRGARVRAKPRALRVPALGPGSAFASFSVVPPETGIVHQVNLEYLARVIESRERRRPAPGVPRHARGNRLAHDDGQRPRRARLGRRRHRGRGRRCSASRSRCSSRRSSGSSSPAAAGRHHRHRSRAHRHGASCARVGVVGKFVEFFGHGLVGLPLADRATIANMAPECGSTCNFFPVDDETLRYLELTARPAERIALVEAYAREQGLFHDPDRGADVLAGRRARPRRRGAEPRRAPPAAGSRAARPRPEAAFAGRPGGLRRRPREHARRGGRGVVPGERSARGHRARARAGRADRPCRPRRRRSRRRRPSSSTARASSSTTASVVIAAITSCTNTSNPAVMVGAGLLAQRAVERGLTRRPWVKSSLAPGSKVVTEYLDAGRADAVSRRSSASTSSATAARRASGTRARCPSRSRRRSRTATWSSAPCCPGTATSRRASTRRSRPTTSPRPRSSSPMRSRAGWTSTCTTEPLGQDRDGNDVYLRELWPSPQEIQTVIEESLRRDMFARTYADVFAGDERWNALRDPSGDLYALGAGLHVRTPAALLRRHAGLEPPGIADIAGARCLVMVGDSVTTDHISPAGSIRPDSPAGRYLIDQGVEHGRLQLVRLAARQPRGDGARHVRERPAAQPARPGRARAPSPCTCPTASETSIYEAAAALPRRGRPAGRARRQGVRVGLLPGLGGEGPVTARRAGRDRRELRADPPLEPAHDGHRAARSSPPGDSAASLGLTGRETFAVAGLENGEAPARYS